ncbi:hypothetical protein CLV28_1020 [Sediminihabitans luteus]|uniref:Uncharacterized protein n=1 Tax=Sediminihabitans luteus TaxID=1138585 RepID=A0A2M9D0S1_9CELL|nr:hypothetical protein [Sediminihabitans luteus]PJJ77794.1 hypothetical protein CLV28_1020 [Sediminihabitans luteus]GII99848.1 hypothetical protein Slu03_22260 [Sediminihabitans luteus]
MNAIGSYDLLPMLGRGKHRNPRRGACFMELASYLAGEKWTDHPACTHPLLAMMARAVNDLTSNAGRPLLAPHVPSVIGLTSKDPHWDVLIALRAATTAFPVAPDDRRQTLAVSILGAERMLDVLDDRPPGTRSARSQEALAAAPEVTAWAERFCWGGKVRPSRFVRDAAPSIVAVSVQALGEASVFDPDLLMRDLLVDTIADCRGWAAVDDPPTALVPADWADVVRPAGADV